MSNLEEVQLTKDDSLPSLEYTLTRKGSGSTTPNLGGFTATLSVWQQGTTTNDFTISVTSGSTTNGQITDPDAGVMRFDFSTGRFDSTGTFFGKISLSSSAGNVETAPDRQSFIVRGSFG